MTNLYTYTEFLNENIFHTLGRIGVGDREMTKGVLFGRYRDDRYALRIFSDMKEDYEKHGKNLKKVNIHRGLNVMTYYFGEYDKYTGTGNKEVGDIEVKINTVNSTGALMEIERWITNPKYDPKHPFKTDFMWQFGMPERDEPITQEDRDKWRRYNKNDELFHISRDIGRKIIKFFIDEYDKQYPQLKTAVSRGPWQIKEIENGEKPTLKTIDMFAKNKVECFFDLKDWADEPKYINWIKNNYGVKTKSKDGYYVVWCYPPPKIDIDKKVDPYGEEEWGEEEEEKIKKWLGTLTKDEIEEEIKKTINKY